MMTQEQVAGRLRELGYYTSDFRALPDGGVAYLHRLLFTCAILRMTPESFASGECYDDRWCYSSLEAARRAMAEWDPDTEPEPSGWHRHPMTGRRRPEGDASREYVEL